MPTIGALGSDTALVPTAVVPKGTALSGASAGVPVAVVDAAMGSPATSATTTAAAARHRRVSITRVKVTGSGGGVHPVHSLIASISIRKRA
jgi:nucleoside phosphorylase